MQTTYFIRRKNAAPKGKLYDRYHNRLRNLKTGEITRKRKLSEHNTSRQEILEQDCEVEHDADETKQQLQYYKELEWEDVKKMWKACIRYRRQHIVTCTEDTVSSLLSSWPCYKHPSAYNLVSCFVLVHS